MSERLNARTQEPTPADTDIVVTDRDCQLADRDVPGPSERYRLATELPLIITAGQKRTHLRSIAFALARSEPNEATTRERGLGT